MAKILIIEDHDNISRSLQDHLQNEGYEIQVATDLAHARENMRFKPDLIILDWMLPDGQGLDFLTEIRKQGHKARVIFLTARTELVDKVLGLEMGANDYMTKPFESRELLARIRVQLRGSTQPESNNPDEKQVLSIGSLAIDRIRHKVAFNETPLDLVKKEYDLLVLFAENPEKVFSRDEILNKVWGYDVYPTTRTVDTHVMLLRQKIHSDLIETVRSVGYRFRVL